MTDTTAISQCSKVLDHWCLTVSITTDRRWQALLLFTKCELKRTIVLLDGELYRDNVVISSHRHRTEVILKRTTNLVIYEKLHSCREVSSIPF